MSTYNYIWKTVLMILSIMLFANASCADSVSSPAAKLWNDGDITPPTLTSIVMQDSRTVIMEFDEKISKQSPTVDIDTNTDISSLQVVNNTLTFQLQEETTPGREYTITAQVQDLRGNSSLIVEKIYGYNPHVPQILINEFTTEGTRSRPDIVELLVLSDGNTAGITLHEGGIDTYRQAVILPSIQVSTGDFIIVHFRPDTNASLTNETSSKTESTHPQSYSTAWDVFSTENIGIANANGSLTLLANPRYTPLDAVVYSDKADNATQKYRGFSNRTVYAWITEIEAASQWQFASDILMPSDAIYPVDSTSTRSISRNSQAHDTNTAQDWHITPTRGATFGNQNTDDVYTP